MLSILTNFGCHWGCRYCVYRENGINIETTTLEGFGWIELEEYLIKNRPDCISLSGGGDPLFNYKNNRQWYRKLFELLNKYDCKLELHTSYILEKFPYYMCELVVFHLTMPTQISLINNKILNLPDEVRAVFVVQDYYTKGLINTIANLVNDRDNSLTQLSFRQFINSRGQVEYYCHDYLKENHMKSWYYIEQCDYNEYFVNDHIETSYLNIK